MANIKDEFGWAIPLTEDEVNTIWDTAILTVDTNVLLDLYRYHSKTRNSILKSLEKFKERLWLSNQVINEFFKNRTKVISNARQDFDKGQEIIKSLPIEISKNIDELIKSNRTISKELIDKIKNKISEEVKNIVQSENDQSKKVSYSDDETIESIVEFFDGKIGKAFTEEDLKKTLEEAEERCNKKIPPGYKDNDKEGDNKYGDYILWKQILQHAKEQNKPIILVTSERKEDWWEKQSGEFVGLRSELKKEAWDVIKKHILVYHTENFLTILAKKESQNIKDNQMNIDEINEAIKEVKQLIFEKEIKENRNRFEKLQIVNKVEQSTELATEHTNIGYISCYINHPTKFFTVSGQLEPNLRDIPTLRVELIDSPSHYLITPHASTGTTYDFNIHMKSRDVMFKVGHYIFKYHAYVEKEDFGSHHNEELVVPCPECGGDYLLDINRCSECEYESIRECQLCHNEINGYELDSAPFCGYCAYKLNKND